MSIRKPKGINPDQLVKMYGVFRVDPAEEFAPGRGTSLVGPHTRHKVRQGAEIEIEKLLRTFADTEFVILEMYHTGSIW